MPERQAKRFDPRDAVRPPGGFVFAWPLAGAPGAKRIDGKRAEWQDGELRIRVAPANVVIETAKKPEIYWRKKFAPLSCCLVCSS